MLISGQLFTVAASDIISSGRVSDLNPYVNGVSQSDERGDYDLYRGEYLSGGLYFERHLSLVHFTKTGMNSSKTRKTSETRNTSETSRIRNTGKISKTRNTSCQLPVHDPVVCVCQVTRWPVVS